MGLWSDPAQREWKAEKSWGKCGDTLFSVILCWCEIFMYSFLAVDMVPELSEGDNPVYVEKIEYIARRAMWYDKDL